KRTILQRDPLGKLQSSYEEEEEQDDGIIADGERVRVPLLMMDGSRNPALSPLQRAVAGDQGPTKLLVSDGTGNSLNLHKPGFRCSTDMAQRQAADAALAQAYQEVALRDANAWRDSDTGGHPLLVNKRGTVPGKQEGDLCQINGRRGRLQLVNGELQC